MKYVFEVTVAEDYEGNLEQCFHKTLKGAFETYDTFKADPNYAECRVAIRRCEVRD